MELPINSKINGMEIIHEGNVDEYSKKRVKFKNTNNTSSNQKYQLLLKTKIDKIPELSSLGVVQLICGLEDEFDVEIPNTVLKKFKTVGDVVKFLEKNA